MAIERLANELVSEEDRELVFNLFKNQPEYADFILEKASRTRDLIEEIFGEC